MNSLAQRITIGSLLKFTLPTIIMMIFTSLYTIVDGFFVSRFINTDALSAVNIVFPLMSVVIAIGTMFGTGITAIVAKKIGEGKQREALEDFTFVVVAAVVVGVVFAVFVYAFLEPLIWMLGANDVIFKDCMSYAFPLFFFLPASILQLLFQPAMVADGRPKLGLLVSLCGGITNIVLDYLFIVPMQMGIAGAALATGIGYSIPAVFGLLYFSLHRTGQLHFKRPVARWKVLLHSAANGSSEMVSNLSASVTTFLFNLIMMRYLGQDGVAAITIVLYMDFLLVAVNLGYSMGVAPLISYNYGCKEHAKLQKIFKLSCLFSMVFAVLVTAGSMIFARPLVSIFAQSGTKVFEFAVSGLVIYALGYLFKGINIYASAMFTAFSDGKTSAILSFARTLLFIVICMLGLTALFGVNGVWFAVPLAEVLTLFLTLYYFKKFKSVYHYGGKKAS